MRIAKPLLLITTPIGVIFGVVEAFRLTGGLAFLMIALLTFMSVAVGMLVLIARREQAEERERRERAGETAATQEPPGA